VRHPAHRRFHRYVTWLCSPAVREQVLEWANGDVGTVTRLKQVLGKGRPKQQTTGPTIEAEAADLFLGLEQSRSSQRVLAMGGKGRFGFTFGQSRVVSLCDADESHGARGVFLTGEPDTVIRIFNSPFGPDVLITTDRLSEGVDLHRYCRHLIHHELDPSPLRVYQRNGRLRRIGSWAARTGKPLCVAFPSFRGTRDERLVRIIRERWEQFGLLMGGVDFPVDLDADGEVEVKQRRVLQILKARTAPASRSHGKAS
jgi:hypothetical protein